MKIDKILNIVKTVKQVCKNYVVLVEIGTFYYCYGKDTFIINYLEKYKIKILENLNNYEKYYELGKAENAIKIRIEKITNYLNTHKNEKELISQIESLINERRKI